MAPQRPQAVRPVAPSAPNRAQQRIDGRRQLTPQRPAAAPNAAPNAAPSARQQFQQQRGQRPQLRQNVAPAGQPPLPQTRQSIQNRQALPNRQAVPNRQAIQRSLNRRNGTPRIDAQAARRGRFAGAALAAGAGAGVGAAAIAANSNRTARPHAGRQQARAARMIARQAWRRGWRAGFVPWVGAVYWPYAYSDLFDYTFFPYAYDDDYWAYAYDDMLDGVFWADGGPSVAYASAPPSGGAAPTRAALAAQAKAADTAAQQACREPGQGITAWPFKQIEQAVKLTGEQKKLLAEMQDAAKRAADAFKAACPSATALTPPGRLQAVLARLNATLAAVEIVRPPLDTFYASLSDEQKARLNLIGPTLGQSATDKTARQDLMTANQQACKDSKPGLVNLPIESIEDAVKPTEAQQPLLDQLEQATNKAVEALAAACPDDIAQTPPGRLAQTEARLKAMIEAAKTVAPALDGFYAGLSDEQKSRFNTMTSDVADDNG